ncbi:LysR substrate-binding domain-containing protein [Elongatibacter sediminis]|uniref:LysR substrate-binding domain-containing protein n=1 Tax=Elongatibacter sediminis TaxID=3119006 RepID=A0AAW9RBA6_9GAMM
MRKALPLNGLRAFEAAARHMSFQKAADELAVTPTAISHQIRQLEDRLDIALFVRRPRPITLTDAGASLFPAVRSALDDLDVAVQAIKPNPDRERLTVSMTNAFATHWMLPRLNRFQERHPEIAVNVHAGEAVVSLEKGEVDCAIRYTSELPEDMICFPLFRDSYFPVCAPELLEDGAPTADLAQLCRNRLLHFEWKRRNADNPTWVKWFDRISQQTEVPAVCSPSRGIRFSEETLAIQGAIQGQGVTLCSTLMTADHIRKKRLGIAFDFRIPGFLSALVYPPAARQRKSITLFRKWLLAEAEAFRAENPPDFFYEVE